MGSARRQHHAQQEAMRRATAEANRFQDMMRAQEEANKKLAEALKPDLSSLKPPRTTASTVGRTVLVCVPHALHVRQPAVWVKDLRLSAFLLTSVVTPVPDLTLVN